MKIENQVVTTIYTLSCPITGLVKYIGKTIKPLKERLHEHISERRPEANKRLNWIASLRKKGLRPVIEPIEEIVDNWEECERYWIAQFRAWGFDLKNMTEGGEGCYGRKHTDETRQKISERQKGKKLSKQHIVNIVAARRINGYSPSATARTKVSKALTGIPKTKEHNIRVGNANRGKTRTDLFKNQCKERLRGKRQPWILRAVIQYSTLGEQLDEFLCVTDAVKSTKISNSAISNCLKNRSKTAGGYIWKYRSNVAV